MDSAALVSSLPDPFKWLKAEQKLELHHLDSRKLKITTGIRTYQTAHKQFAKQPACRLRKSMPLPQNSFTIHGGCNCKAIRYVVSVPPFSERPPTPYCTPGADIGDLRIPAVFIDHCNDCRRATSSILPMALVCDIKTVQTSLLPRCNEAEGVFEESDASREWLPAADIFNFKSTNAKALYLSVYKSTPDRSRWFCSRCGTMLAYSIDPGVIPPELGWPTMLDIWLGTVDREDLEKDYMRPERMMWCEKGVPWIRELARNGAGGIPEHPLTKIDKLVD